MAKIVQNSHFSLAIIFIFIRPEATGQTDEIKYKVPKFATACSGTLYAIVKLQNLECNVILRQKNYKLYKINIANEKKLDLLYNFNCAYDFFILLK
jgi:hypothetical protein